MVAATLAAQSYYISELFKHFKFYLKFRQINASVFNESLFNLVSCGFRLLHLRLVCQDSLCISYAHRLTIILCLFFSFPLFLSLSPSCSYFLLWVDIFIDIVSYLSEPCLKPDCSTLLYLPVKNHVLAA